MVSKIDEADAGDEDEEDLLRLAQAEPDEGERDQGGDRHVAQEEGRRLRGTPRRRGSSRRGSRAGCRPAPPGRSRGRCAAGSSRSTRVSAASNQRLSKLPTHLARAGQGERREHPLLRRAPGQGPPDEQDQRATERELERPGPEPAGRGGAARAPTATRCSSGKTLISTRRLSAWLPGLELAAPSRRRRPRTGWAAACSA